MGVKEPKLNVKGELIDFRDVAKIVKVLTTVQRDKIQKFKDDIVDINAKKVLCKQFEELNKKLRTAITPFTSSFLDDKNVFKEKRPVPVGITPAEFVSYIEVEVKPGSRTPDSIITVQPANLATAAKWQSCLFSSKIGSATQSQGGTNPNLFSEGSFKVLVQNNAITFSQNFSSKFNVVGTSSGQFTPGKFFIKDEAVSITQGDDLTSISSKINRLSIGVQASVEQNDDGIYKFILRTEKTGAEYTISLEDPNGVFTNLIANPLSDGVTERYKEYKEVNLNSGDSLEKIVYKINAFEKSTKLRADVFQISGGKYALILKSTSPGIANAFEIKDGNTVLNGSNSGSVFNNTFYQAGTVTQGASDAEVKINDTLIKRTTNNFTIYDGIEIKLKAVSTKPLMFEISSDTNIIFKKILDFVEIYNEFKKSYDGNNPGDRRKSRDFDPLRDNLAIKESFMRIEELLNAIEILDIGISKGKVEFDVKEGDKEVKKEYNDMIVLDKMKLFDSLSLDPDKTRKAFELSFDSSSGNFVEPIVQKQIGLNNKPLGSNKIELDLKINLDAAKVQSKSSIIFADTSNVVDATGQDTKKFRPGTFWINGSGVTISSGMNLQAVVNAINSASQISRVSATLNSNYMSFTEYSGSFKASNDVDSFKGINLYDPGGLLQNTFTPVATTAEFDVQSTTATSTKIDPTKTLYINGVAITTPDNTLGALIKAINDKTDATRVVAKTQFSASGNLIIQFSNKSLRGIVIDNTDGCLSVGITGVQTQQTGNLFFDTSKALTSKVMVNGQTYGKTCVLSLSGDEVTSGGMIKVLNADTSNMKIDNLELLFVGSVNDDAIISVSQGLAETVLRELEGIFGLRDGYKGSTSTFMEIMTALDNKKTETSNTIKDKEEILKIKEAALTKRFSDAVAKFDQQSAYDYMARAIMGFKDED